MSVKDRFDRSLNRFKISRALLIVEEWYFSFIFSPKVWPVFLCTDDASYITGTTILIDVGWTIE